MSGFPQSAPVVGGLLAIRKYTNGGASRTYALGTSLAALDTTNLVLNVTVPANGCLDLDFGCYCQLTEAGAPGTVSLGFINASGGATVGDVIPVAQSYLASEQLIQYVRGVIHVEGLTPGALSLQFAGAVVGSGTASGYVFADALTTAIPPGRQGPIVMRAYSSQASQ